MPGQGWNPDVLTSQFSPPSAGGTSLNTCPDFICLVNMRYVQFKKTGQQQQKETEKTKKPIKSLTVLSPRRVKVGKANFLDAFQFLGGILPSLLVAVTR